MPVTTTTCPRAGLPQGALDQQVPAFVEPETSEIYLHRASCNPDERVDRAEAIDRRGKLRITLDAPGHPLLQAFEIEQRADFGIGVRHAQEQLAETRDRLRGRSSNTVKLQ